MRRLWNIANRLAPVLLLIWGLPFVLYLVLTKFGQAEDLMRATTEDNRLNFFLVMSLLGFGFAGWAMIGASLRTGATTKPASEAPNPNNVKVEPLPRARNETSDEVSDCATVVIATLLSTIGPAIVAFAYHAPGTGGAFLLYMGGIVAPACLLGFSMLPSQRKGYTVGWWIHGFTIGFAVVAFIAYGIVFLWPDYWGLLLGPVAVLLVVGGAAMWAIWFVGRRAPIVSILLLGVIVFAVYTGRFGGRPVRTVSGPQTRVSSAAYAHDWLAKHPGKRPLFITSDGGGIRSAYWTAILLGALADDVSSFSGQVYVASGVSGGSVGIAEFASLLSEEKARQALSFDFLSVSLARLLTRDPLDSVTCYGWGWRFLCSGTDRQVAAESIFEATCPRLGQPISAPLPFAIALNATNADSGDRLVLSNVEIGGPEDLLEHMPKGQTLRLSTAMLLSARFPVISPVGELKLDGGSVRIIDGGYFDNSGGATALEMLQVLLDAAGKTTVKPIGVIVTNDPLRARGKFCESPPETAGEAHTSLADLLVTPRSRLSVRSMLGDRMWPNRIAATFAKPLRTSAVRCANCRYSAAGTMTIPSSRSAGRCQQQSVGTLTRS